MPAGQSLQAMKKGMVIYMEKTGAIILAAGLSTRMKKFKPMLMLGDSSMILNIIGTLKDAKVDTIVVVLGYHSDKLKEHLSSAGVIFVKNERYAKSQMLDSVKLGLDRIKNLCDRVLIMPSDVPLFNLDTVIRILMMKEKLVRPVCEGIPGHPVMIACDLIEKICSYTGTEGLRGAMEHTGIKISELHVEDEGIYLDADTQEDYEQLIRWNMNHGGCVRLHAVLQLRLIMEDIFFGPGTAQFLEMVDETGSIQSACACMNLSYSKGWKMVNKIEKQLGVDILIRKAGGIAGGGSSLTYEGHQLLSSYRSFEEEMQHEAGVLFEKYFPKERWTKPIQN
jgi:molybdenum cofactor cytidylyltransferase